MSWNHEDLSVYMEAYRPATWTKFDLSATVGQARRLVLLVAVDESLDTFPIMRFRPSGETEEWGDDGGITGPFGSCQAKLYSSAGEFGFIYAAYIVVPTGPDGAVDWICSTAGAAQVILAGWDDSYHHHGVTLADGNSPTPAAWTDLDLSPYLGARETMTICRTSGTVGTRVALRPDTDLYTSDRRYGAVGGPHSAASGAAIVQDIGEVFPLLTETDAAGQIEYFFHVAATPYRIDLLGHIPHWAESGSIFGPLAGVNVPTMMDISAAVSPGERLVALEVSHDDGGNNWVYVRRNGGIHPAYAFWGSITGFQEGAHVAMCEAGRKVVLVCDVDAVGKIEWQSSGGAGIDWTFRVIGSCGDAAPSPPGIALEYPVDGTLVEDDTEIRFRVSDDYGIHLATLQVKLSAVDQSIPLITDGAFTANATGVIDPIAGVPGLAGYFVTIFPATDLADRVWTVTVDCEDFDGEALP